MHVPVGERQSYSVEGNSLIHSADRLAAVYATGLLDTDVEEAFDRLTRLAVRLVEIPAAFISLVDENRDFYKSACGFGEPLATARELTGETFCHYTIHSDKPLVIPDTVADPRYRDVPTVKSLGVAAYVGVPLLIDGQVIGAFCAIDMKPRAWTDRDVETLSDLAAIATSEIELRGANRQLAEQASELEMQTEELQASTEELQVSTEELMERTEVAEAALRSSEEASAALTISRQRYRTLTEAVPVQVWTATPEGGLDFVSASAASYFDTADENILGAGWTTFVHPEDIGAAATKWMHSLATGDPYQAEFRLRNGATGEYRWHLARALPDRDAAGKIMGWIGSNTDVTTERVARAAAEAANRSKSEFLAVMSHELRTPLNAIGGYTEILAMELRGPVTEMQRHDLDRISRSQRHLLGLINGILDYAKIDAGMMHFASEAVPMDEILATCEALTIPQASEKHISLEYPPSECHVVARADREKVQQIVLNLVSNAIKFTDPGGHVTVTCEVDEDRVIVAVADNGSGIPGDQLESVFQPFVQIDSKHTREQPGTGLGLAISRDLARGMGGDLVAESAVGEGSTFTAEFPIIQAGESKD